MPLSKPFHRNFRQIKRTHPNAGYSAVAYIRDRDYAQDPEHYVRAFLLIQDDLKSIFEYVEPSDECKPAYSYRIHALFMRTCIEIEANFKAILSENTYSAPPRGLNMSDYKRVDATHHLSSYEVMLPIWTGGPLTLKPFEPWRAVRGVRNANAPLPWYQAYNASKHDRHHQFKQANLENLVAAIAALLVLISSQFHAQDFSAAATVLGVDGYDYHPLEPTTGEFFRIKYPDDWTDPEMYDFDWKVLESKADRFDKINYDLVF